MPHSTADIQPAPARQRHLSETVSPVLHRQHRGQYVGRSNGVTAPEPSGRAGSAPQGHAGQFAASAAHISRCKTPNQAPGLKPPWPREETGVVSVPAACLALECPRHEHTRFMPESSKHSLRPKPLVPSLAASAVSTASHSAEDRQLYEPAWRRRLEWPAGCHPQPGGWAGRPPIASAQAAAGPGPKRRLASPQSARYGRLRPVSRLRARNPNHGRAGARLHPRGDKPTRLCCDWRCSKLYPMSLSCRSSVPWSPRSE
jgi:hypothetical protein